MLHGFSFLFVVESAWGEGIDGQNDKFVADETEGVTELLIRIHTAQ